MTVVYYSDIVKLNSTDWCRPYILRWCGSACFPWTYL